MQLTDPLPRWPRLSDIVAAATVISGGLASASYAFALGYIFAIEPRFLPAFSFGDLLLLFVSSSSTAIFASILLIPSLAMFFTRGLLKSFLRRVEAEAEDDADVLSETKGPIPPAPQGAAMAAGDWAALVVSGSVTVAVTFIGVQDAIDGNPHTFSPFPEFLLTFGVVVMLLTTSTSTIVRTAMPLILSVYILAALYVVGDVSGRRDLVGSAKSREMPCAFVEERSDCFDVLLLGSEAAVLRKNGRVVLLARSRLRSVQSRETGLIGPIKRANR